MKLQAQLPGPEKNGLTTVARSLVDRPQRTHVVIAVIDTKKITSDADDGSVEPTIRIRRIEVIAPADKETAEKLMRRALEHRSGDTVLPLEVEDELTELFNNVDMETGEVLDHEDEDND